MTADEAFAAALDARLRVEYQRGLRDGLAVAERIVGWLNRQPDRQWQAEVRGWAETAIKKAREPNDDT